MYQRIYKRRLWKLFFSLAAGSIVLGTICTIIFGVIDTLAYPIRRPDADVVSYNYDAQKNMLSGGVKNNTVLPMKLAEFGFAVTSGGIKRSELTVRVPQLKPQEHRAFRETCPPDWKNMGTDTVDLSSTSILLK